MRSYFRLLACLASLWTLLFAPAGAQTLVLREATAVESDAPRFSMTAPAQARVVGLPDDWAASRPGRQGPVWYRAVFNAPPGSAQDSPLGLYVRRGCADMQVRLNGALLVDESRGYGASCRAPRLVVLPGALLRGEGNELELRLAGRALPAVASRERAAGLSVLEIGPHAALALRQARHAVLGVTLPQAASLVLLLLAAVMLAMSRTGTRQGQLAWFALLSAAWALLLVPRWWPALPLPHPWVDVLEVALLAVAALAAVQFAFRRAARRPARPLGLALWLQCAAAPLALLAIGEARLHATAMVLYVLFGAEVLLAVGVLFWRRWRVAPRTAWTAGATLLAVALLVGGEFAFQQGVLPAWTSVPTDVGVPLLLVAAGLRLVRQYGRALQAAEQGRLMLETSIREATAEIERNFAQLAELRVEQVTERERKRIAADLHDDLGAKLLTIVHTSESERISTLAREALEEMRLSVRGLTGKPVRLLDALGDWRAETVSRLAQAGVESDWSSPAEDLEQTLSARAYVQTTRILREAVSNVIKHSGATHCTVHCTIAEGDFQLVIQDNGRGIPLELDGRLDRGHGMSSMKHRAKQLHGQCLVESGPGYGTVIRLTLPLEQQAAKV